MELNEMGAEVNNIIASNSNEGASSNREPEVWITIRCHVKGRPAPDLAYTVSAPRPRGWSTRDCFRSLDARSASILNLAQISLLRTARDVGWCFIVDPRSIGTAVYGRKEDGSQLPGDYFVESPEMAFAQEETRNGQKIKNVSLDLHVFPSPYRRDLVNPQQIAAFWREYYGFLEELVRIPLFPDYPRNEEIAVPLIPLTREAEEPPRPEPLMNPQPQQQQQQQQQQQHQRSQSVGSKRRRKLPNDGRPAPRQGPAPAMQRPMGVAAMIAQEPAPMAQAPDNQAAQIADWRRVFNPQQ